MKKFGLSLEKDGGYSKLIVVCSALLSGFTFGLPGFQGVLTSQWKQEYGFKQSSATLHQRYFQGFLYFGSMILTSFYKSFTPRKWLVISSFLGLVGYLIIYLAYYLPIEYFTVCQLAMGILAGLGAGLSFGIICITPQHWLDKTQKKLNPYLFIGAPLFVTASALGGVILIEMYSWSGAHLIMVGFFMQQLIVTVLFSEHYSEKENNIEKRSLSSKIKEYKEILTNPTVIAMLFNCAVCSGFIMSGVFTEIQNVAMEEGVDWKKAATLVIFSAIPECLLFRPLWGKVTDWWEASTLQIVWCLILMISQFIIAIATEYVAFIVGMVTFSLGLAGYSGLKFVIFIELVGVNKLPNALFFDTLFDAIATIVVPSICADISEKTGNKKILFYVNCVAGFLCIFVSFYIRRQIMDKKKKEEKDGDSKDGDSKMDIAVTVT